MFEYNLALVFGYSVVYETKMVSSPNGVVDDCVCGSPQPPTTGESTASQLQAYIQNLPALLNTTAAQTLPVGQQTQNAQNVLAPQQQALQTSMATQDLPGLYQLGNSLNSQSVQGGLQNANTAATGSGANLAQNLQSLDQSLNPQYYSTRNTESNALNSAIPQLSTNLNGSDTAQINRSLAQQDAQKGLLNAPSQTAAISNAVQFGNQGAALQGQKVNTLSQAINSATSFLPSSQGTFNTANVATGGTAGTTPSNPGASQFLGTTGTSGTSGASSTNTSLGNSLLGGINSTAANTAQINAGNSFGGDASNILGSLPS